jgi:two-component system, response regulator PdtaR
MQAPADGAEPLDEAKAILLVEDEILIRLVVAEELAEAGFRVIQAANGDEAVKILQSSIPLDLVMTDVRMPGSVDGLRLAALVRAGWPELKIVMMSGHLLGPPPDLQVDLFLSKPYRISSAIEKVKQLLSGDRQ